MTIVVSNIVEVSMNKTVLWINLRVDDWKVEMAITASKGAYFSTESVTTDFHWLKVRNSG